MFCVFILKLYINCTLKLFSFTELNTIDLRRRTTNYEFKFEAPIQS